MTSSAFQGSFYDPPYDSPIEDWFAINAIKYLDEAAQMEKQVDAPTPWGTFRMDFLLTGGGPRVAIECDGRDYHDQYRDEWRDALLLGTNATDTIYHFRGADLHYHVADLLYLLMRWEPHLFSDRGKTNLARLASAQVKQYGNTEPTGGTIIGFPPQPEYGLRGITFIDVERRSRIIPPGRRQHWTWLYKCAQEYDQHTLDALIEAHSASHRD